ncbi:MAG: hypothetical protein QW062_04010, partial [Thermoplasmatales archaeon]
MGKTTVLKGLKDSGNKISNVV